jgi:DnaK suppressor protein
MTEQDLQYFKTLLLEQRTEANDTLAEFDRMARTDAAQEASEDRNAYSLHMADRGTDAMEREKSQLFAQRSGDYVEYVEEALYRIKDGTFGACRVCSQEISRARLEAVPIATQCIACKEKGETKSS